MREPERLEGSLDLERQADTTAVAERAADDGRWARGREDAERARRVLGDRVRTRLGQSSGHGRNDEGRETSGSGHGGVCWDGRWWERFAGSQTNTVGVWAQRWTVDKIADKSQT